MGGGAAVEGLGAGQVGVEEVAEVGLEAVGGVDGAGGREVVALAAVAVDGVEVAAEGDDRDREPEAAEVGVVGVVAPGVVGDRELAGLRPAAAVDRRGGDAGRAPGVRVADQPQDLGAGAVGRPGDELVVGGGAAVEGLGAGQVGVEEVAEVGLEAVGGVDGAGGREVVALAAVAVDGVEVAHQAAGDMAREGAARVRDEAVDRRAQVELVGGAVAVAVARAGYGAVDIVVVDVDRVAAVGLVVRAAVLADPLVVAPVAVRDVRVVGRPPPVPVRDPDVIRLPVGGPVAAPEVDDARARAAVDARDIAARADPGGPPGEEPQHRLAVGGGPRVALHVEVDGAPAPEPERLRIGDRVPGRRPPLGLGLAALDRRAAAHVRGRLQPDVDRDRPQPSATCFRTQLGVRFGWLQPRFAPPM